MILIVVIAILVIFTNTADAATPAESLRSVIGSGIGISTWDEQLTPFAIQLLAVARMILVMMTALSGTMICLGLQEGLKKVWYIMLTIGLVFNMGDIMASFWTPIPENITPPAVDWEKVLGKSDEIEGVISGILSAYLSIIAYGAAAIVPIAQRILLFVGLVDLTLRFAFNTGKSSILNTFISETLKIGFLMFLIQNWLGTYTHLNIADTISVGFQQLGYLAAGVSDHAQIVRIDSIISVDSHSTLNPESIISNMFKTMSLVTSKFISAGPASPFFLLFYLLCWLLSMFCCVYTAIELFCAIFVYYTLGIISIPLLAFGACRHTSFLMKGSIRGMFINGVNLAVITFLQGILCRMFNKYVITLEDRLATSESASSAVAEHIFSPEILQLLIISLLMAVIVRKIPQLLNGLLSGNPGALSANDVTAPVLMAAGAIIQNSSHTLTQDKQRDTPISKMPQPPAMSKIEPTKPVK